MAQVKSKNTTPEKLVRSMLHRFFTLDSTGMTSLALQVEYAQNGKLLLHLIQHLGDPSSPQTRYGTKRIKSN